MIQNLFQDDACKIIEELPYLLDTLNAIDSQNKTYYIGRHSQPFGWVYSSTIARLWMQSLHVHICWCII